jgi:hypothetical protein
MLEEDILQLYGACFVLLSKLRKYMTWNSAALHVMVVMKYVIRTTFIILKA